MSDSKDILNDGGLLEKFFDVAGTSADSDARKSIVEKANDRFPAMAGYLLSGNKKEKENDNIGMSYFFLGALMMLYAVTLVEEKGRSSIILL